jgi:cell wall-associated NlpC family hydrolase
VGRHYTLPRNASQQAETGDEVESIEKTEAGDLAFFSDSGDGIVTHVGMMLGEGRVAHCSIGRAGFYIEKLSDRKDPYVKQLAERFVKAKRVL